jgi:CBS domain-containing protein
MTATAAGLGTLVTYNPTVVHPDYTLADIQRLMDTNLIHHLPVVDGERRLIGIVSDLDISQAVLTAGQGSPHPPQVEAIMVRELVTVEIDDPPHVALSLMLANAIHSVPVLDRGRLIGIVTSTDLIREFSYGEMQAYREPVSMHMSVCKLQVDATATLDEALQLIAGVSSTYLPVTMGGCPVGVVSLRGLRRLAEGVSAPRAAGNTPVARLLGPTPKIRPGDKLGHAASGMVEGKVKALSVTDRRNELLGLLTQDDILRAMARELERPVA